MPAVDHETHIPDGPQLPAARAAARDRGRRWPRRVLLLVAVATALVLLGPRVTTWVLARGDIVSSPRDLPRITGSEDRAAIVFGAGVVGERPSPLLRDRIDAAVQLLQAGRVDMLIMSGDNTTQYYDEPTVMRQYAIDAGAPAELVAADYAGRRTWDSCVRARKIFGISEAVVVTNAFHVDRTLVTCRAAGINTTGYSVDDAHHGIGNRIAWRARELAATGRALVDVWVLRPAPAVGGERIDPYEPCELYRSLAPSVAERSADDFAKFDC